MIQRYHVYKEVQNAEVDEELRCEREIGNHSNTFAVAVKKGTATVDHMPTTKYIIIFMQRGGNIQCRVMGTRHTHV